MKTYTYTLDELERQLKGSYCRDQIDQMEIGGEIILPEEAITSVFKKAQDEYAELKKEQARKTSDQFLTDVMSALFGVEPERILTETELEKFDSDYNHPEDRDSEYDFPFIWITRKGEALKPCEMATPHLFYALRMLFNNTVPPVFRVGKFKRYSDVTSWSDYYKMRAFTELTTELMKRDLEIELSDMAGTTIDNQLVDIAANIVVILALGL